MRQEQLLSAEDQCVLVGFANKVLPLAFDGVRLAIDAERRAIIQKRSTGGDGSEGLIGMVNIRVESTTDFTVDVFVTSNLTHGKVFQLKAWKNKWDVRVYLINVENSSWMSVEPELIQGLVSLLALFEKDYSPCVKVEKEVAYFIEQMMVKQKQDLIDHYLETGAFDKIIELQKYVG